MCQMSPCVIYTLANLHEMHDIYNAFWLDDTFVDIDNTDVHLDPFFFATQLPLLVSESFCFIGSPNVLAVYI